MADDINSEVNNGNLAEFEKKLVEIDPKVFEGIPKPKKQQIIRSIVVSMQKTHIGPLPDPETLRDYCDLIPNGGERIMQMAEKQAEHRMKLEDKVIRGQMTQSNLGQIFAFLIGLAALGSATYCIVSGYQWAGSILGVGGLTGLVTAFLKGRAQQDKSLEEKRPKLKGK